MPIAETTYRDGYNLGSPDTIVGNFIPTITISEYKLLIGDTKLPPSRKDYISHEKGMPHPVKTDLHPFCIAHEILLRDHVHKFKLSPKGYTSSRMSIYRIENSVNNHPSNAQLQLIDIPVLYTPALTTGYTVLTDQQIALFGYASPLPINICLISPPIKAITEIYFMGKPDIMRHRYLFGRGHLESAGHAFFGRPTIISYAASSGQWLNVVQALERLINLSCR